MARKFSAAKAAAIAAGLTRYDSGKPCKYGHIALHYVDGQCVECKRLNRHGRTPEQQKRHSYLEKAKRIAMRAQIPKLCECCGQPERMGRKSLAFDHCHVTGVFRGWLCSGCNTSIGRLGDTIEGLMMAVAYLERAKKNPLRLGKS